MDSSAAALTLTVRPTVLLIQKEKEVQQLFTATISSSKTTVAPRMDVVVSDGKKEWRVSINSLSASDTSVRLFVPRAARAQNLLVYLADGERQLTAPQTLLQMPVRDWKIFFQTTPHIDLGYTDLVANVEAKLRSMVLDDVFGLLRQTADYPEGERLHWTSESSWFLDMALKNLSAATRADLEASLARRQLSVGAMDFNLHSEACTQEELIRSLFRAQRLVQTYPGLDASAAMQSDPPGYAWGLAQALVSSGIRYLAIWANNGHPLPANLPELFYWETPDGGRLLTAYQTGYAASRFGEYRLLDKETGKELRMDQEVLLKEIEENTNHTLMDLEGMDFPFDALLGRIVGRDNGLPPEHMAELAKAWNARYLSPRIIFSGPGGYLRHIEENFRNRIPVLRGDMNSWWNDGAATLARDTGLARQARARAPIAEMLASINAWHSGALTSYPSKELEELYYQLLRYDEHTFGLRAYNVRGKVLSQGDNTEGPEWERWRQSWRDKATWAQRADQASRQLIAEGLQKLSSQVATRGDAVSVFNPSTERRDELVRLSWTAGSQPPTVVNPDDGRPLPSQVSSGELWFFATGIPALGYKTFLLEKTGRSTASGSASAQSAMENAFYKIAVDSSDPGIRSIIDKETGAELVDPKAPYLFNQILYQEYTADANRDRHRDVAGSAKPVRAALRKRLAPQARPAVDPDDLAAGGVKLSSSLNVTQGRVFDEIIWTSALTEVPGSIPHIEQVVRLYHPVKRIELINRLSGKKPTAKAEGIYLSLPFNIPNFSWRLENAGVVFDPYNDLLPGANPNIFSAGRWILCANADRFIAMSPLEAPLVEFGEIRSLKLEDVGSYRPGRSHLYSHLMDNFWGTNFPMWQSGDFVFSYSLTSGAKHNPVVRARQLGEGLHLPLAAIRLRPQQGPLPGSASVLNILGPRIHMLALKRSEDGKAFVFRCQEADGQEGTLTLRPGLLTFASAHLANALEKPGEALSLTSEGIKVPVRKHEIVTLILGVK
ncbi:MAG: glycosyl hydrolase-related protein [Acidobacteria bacterium]|nr:glycosyl hydrolase-related protein [Acidobacteriota bacterium]MCI0722457.1 glycosyl hydrolase-related protein [Acidobacteriota bacterium]